MKKFVIASVTALLTLALLASCADKKAGPDDTQKPAATAPTTTGQADNEPTSTTPQTSDVPADTDATTQKLTLNEDMLAYYGMTFDELQAKYGKVVGCGAIRGSLSFQFESGYGKYGFSGQDARDPAEWFTVDNGVEKQHVMLPKDDAKCNCMFYGDVTKLFSEMPENLSFDDIAKIDGMSLENKDILGVMYDSSYKYEAEFKYVVNEDKCFTVMFFYNTENTIDSDSIVEIYPRTLDKNETEN